MITFFVNDYFSEFLYDWHNIRANTSVFFCNLDKVSVPTACGPILLRIHILSCCFFFAVDFLIV